VDRAVKGFGLNADHHCWTILNILSSIRTFSLPGEDEFCSRTLKQLFQGIAKNLKMKNITLQLGITLLCLMAMPACKKSSSTASGNSSVIAGFWTYKEDPAIDYWNSNVLFKSDGTFRMYTALSLDDTAAAQAIADTANEVVTFGTFTVNGKNVKMVFSEFTIIGLNFTGSLNSSNNILIGNLDNNQPGAASPLWYLTKP
jgi:hypothetical protein